MQQPQRRSRTFADFLPRSPEDLPQVYAWFEQMRSNQPVFRAEQMPIWQVFRYADVQAVITDYNRFSSQATFGDSFLANTLVTTDPPDHRHEDHLRRPPHAEGRGGFDVQLADDQQRTRRPAPRRGDQVDDPLPRARIDHPRAQRAQRRRRRGSGLDGRHAPQATAGGRAQD